MNIDPERATLALNLNKLVVRMMLFKAWRDGCTSGRSEFNLDCTFMLEGLEMCPGLTTTGLSKLIGKSVSQVAMYRDKLEAAGLIEVRRIAGEKSLPIFITEKGQTELEIALRNFHCGSTGWMMVEDRALNTEFTAEHVAEMQRAVELILVRLNKVFDANPFLSR